MKEDGFLRPTVKGNTVTPLFWGRYMKVTGWSAGLSALAVRRQRQQGEGAGYKASRPTSGDTLPSARPHLKKCGQPSQRPSVETQLLGTFHIQTPTGSAWIPGHFDLVGGIVFLDGLSVDAVLEPLFLVCLFLFVALPPWLPRASRAVSALRGSLPQCSDSHQAGWVRTITHHGAL